MEEPLNRAANPKGPIFNAITRNLTYESEDKKNIKTPEKTGEEAGRRHRGTSQRRQSQKPDENLRGYGTSPESDAVHRVGSVSGHIINFFFFDNSGIWAATFPTIPSKGVQRPNGRDVKSVVAKTRTRVAGSTAVPPLPPSYERLV
ncbi:hypothetical protein YC2023_030100 [Brassica napus]